MAHPHFIRLHLKVLSNPDTSISNMLDGMKSVFDTALVDVEIASREKLDLPHLNNDLPTGCCDSKSLTDEQRELFNHRNNVVDGDIVIYFIHSLDLGVGCSAHPGGKPGAVIASRATEWTLAHEVGHVFNLEEANTNNRNLMFEHGTAAILNPPPDLTTGQIARMQTNPLTHHR